LGYAYGVFDCFGVVVGEEYVVESVVWGMFGDEVCGFVVRVVGVLWCDGVQFRCLFLDVVYDCWVLVVDVGVYELAVEVE